MKTQSIELAGFIRAFGIALPGKGVCFEAMVYAFSAHTSFQVDSEVHIITIEAKKKDILYILNTDLAAQGFPDMFEIGKVEAIFKEKKGLLIKGCASLPGEYAILIQPSGKDCAPPANGEFPAGPN